jgi:WD40 repeat protein
MATYKFGGSLPADAPTYVVRRADRDLESYLQAGESCYILNSRQMGKSSLKLRTIRRLETQGIACVNIDLTSGGAHGIDAAKFYRSIADDLATELDLESELAAFWDRYAHLSDIKRLGKFIDTVILKQIESKIVIFIDEIDNVISLDSFTDDLFGLIRYYSELGAAKQRYRRLAFVLIGVAAPTDLIENKQRTPFNVGRSIELNGFQLDTDDLSPLINGLADRPNPELIVAEILKWTGGQPFLTQKICQLVVESPPELKISWLIQKHIIDNWESKDNPVHLTTIANRILANEEKSSYLLDRYRQIISPNSNINADRSQEQQELKLSGLVVERDGKLRPYNPIYEQIFNLEWIAKNLKRIPHSPALLAWIDAGKPKELLLRGEPLQEAIEWRDLNPQSKLSDDRHDFLRESQNQKADRDLKKSQAITKKVNKILTRLIVGFTALFIVFLLTLQSQTTIDALNKIERTSSQIIQQYEFAPIHSLRAAIANAQRFQKLPFNILGKSTYTPQLALQKIVDGIQESNEVNTYQDGINSIIFCTNERLLAGGSDGTINVWNERNKIEDSNSSKIFKLTSKSKINSISTTNDRCNSNFVTGDSNGDINLWKWGKSEPIYTVFGHQKGSHNNGGVQNVRLTRDGRHIFSTGATDGKLKKWRIENERIIAVPFGGNLDGVFADYKGVVSLKLNATEDLIGTAGKDGTAKIWDFDGNAAQTKVLTGHLDAVNSIHFCFTELPNKCQFAIATGSSDGTVKLWNNDGKFHKTINADVGEIRVVKFSPDGKLLATASSKSSAASNGSSIGIWNLADDRPKLVTEFKGHQGGIESIRFNPNFNDRDERDLATSGAQDSIIRFWRIPKILASDDKHQEKINSVRFDLDSTHFITAGLDGKAGWWSLDRGADSPRLIDYYPHGTVKLTEFTAIRIRPNTRGPKIVAAGDANGFITLLSITNDKIQEIDRFDTGQGNIESMDWNHRPYNGDPNSYLLATTGNQEADLKIWKISIGVDVSESIQTILDRQPLFQQNWKCSHLTVRFSKDGKNLLLGGNRGKIILLKKIDILPQQPEIHTLPLAIKSKVTIGFSPDNQSFTIVSHEGEILRSSIKPELIKQEPIETYQAGTENIAIARNGYIATGGAGAALRMWDVEGHQLADFRGYWGTINSVNFSEDGKYLLAGGDDGVPRVWRIDRQIPELIAQAQQWLK